MNNIQQNNQGVTEQIPYGSGTIHHNLNDLTPAASEIGYLWSSYLAETMGVCYLKKWAKESTDPEIHTFLQYVLDMSTQKIDKMENLFKSINYPIPAAFGEKDVDVNAPPLFSQTFTCSYVRMMQTFIMIHFAAATAVSYRTDFRNFFSESMKIANDIQNKGTEILLAKGILQKHPSIVAPHSIENVNDKNYYGSFFRIFGEERPLNALEIAHIYELMSIKQLIRTLNLGCSQIVKSEEIKNFLVKCIDMADSQLNFFSNVFKEENIPVPSLSEINITDSLESGISDRLILLHCTGAISYIVTAYGISSATTMRKDIVLKLAHFTAEVIGLAKSGADLAIKVGWLEKIPETADRQKLIH